MSTAEAGGQDAGKAVKARQKRAPMPTGNSEGKSKDWSTALAILASVGATPNDPRVQRLGRVFRNQRSHKDFIKNKRFVEKALGITDDPWQEPWDDFQKIKRALDIELATEAGEKLRAHLIQVFRDERARVFPLECIFRNGRPIKKAKRGPAGARHMEQTISTARWTYGETWNWEVCAAAVFLTGRYGHAGDYAMIRKSFQSWRKRHPTDSTSCLVLGAGNELLSPGK